MSAEKDVKYVNPFPTREELDKAAARAREARTAEHDAPIGTVLGLPDGDVAAVMPPDLSEAAREALRAKWTARGYERCKAPVVVVGLSRPCEVWTARRADWDQRRAEFNARELRRRR